MASVTFQNYFRLYDKLAGMTGTALTEAAEFMDIYGLDVVEVPTNVPVARDDEDDQVFRTRPRKGRRDCRSRSPTARSPGSANPGRHHVDREVRDAVGNSLKVARAFRTRS